MAKTKKIKTVTEMTVKLTIVNDGDDVTSMSKKDWENDIKRLLDPDDCHVTELKNFVM